MQKVYSLREFTTTIEKYERNQAIKKIKHNQGSDKKYGNFKLNFGIDMKQGWEIKKLGELCEIKGRIGYRGYTVNDLVEKGEGAITLSPSNIQNNQFNTEKCTYISWFK